MYAFLPHHNNKIPTALSIAHSKSASEDNDRSPTLFIINHLLEEVGTFAGDSHLLVDAVPDYQSKDRDGIPPKAYVEGLATILFNSNIIALNIMGNHAQAATVTALGLHVSGYQDYQSIQAISGMAPGKMLWIEVTSQSFFVCKSPHIGQG